MFGGRETWGERADVLEFVQSPERKEQKLMGVAVARDSPPW